MNMVLGYVLPAIITLMTLITEFAAPECADFKPSFASDAGCFFATTDSKILWFYFPIGTFLLTNTVMFCLAVVTLCQAESAKNKANKLNIRSGQRTPKMDKYVMLTDNDSENESVQILKFLFDREVSSPVLKVRKLLILFNCHL